jgi:CBS-domain-containing membrane protein
VDAGGAVVGILSQTDLMAKVPSLKIARSLKTVSRKERRHPMAAL